MTDYTDAISTATRLRAQRDEIERLRAQTWRLRSELRNCLETCQLQRLELADKDRRIADRNLRIKELEARL